MEKDTFLINAKKQLAQASIDCYTINDGNERRVDKMQSAAFPQRLHLLIPSEKGASFEIKIKKQTAAINFGV